MLFNAMEQTIGELGAEVERAGVVGYCTILSQTEICKGRVESQQHCWGNMGGPSRFWAVDEGEMPLCRGWFKVDQGALIEDRRIGR